MRTKITIGTRGSKLSLIQTDLIAQALKQELPSIEIKIKIISVKGDRDKQTPIPSTVVGKAWFTAEIEEALMNHEIDLAMHSLKDVPPEIAQGSIILPILKRADPRDVLVSKQRLTLEQLPAGAIIGTDSSRRKAQILALRPDLRVESIRGNVETRVRKVQQGNDGEHYDAAILAAAGLARLDMLDVITEFFPAETFTPAPGQGIIAAQAHADESEVVELLQRIQDPNTVAAERAERAFVDTIGGGCKSPIGAYAIVAGNTLTLYGMIADDEGTQVIRESKSGATGDAESIGANLAQRMMQAFGTHA